jgi:hypothetical protein
MKMKWKMMAIVLMGSLAKPVLAVEGQDTLVIENANKVKIETRDTVQRIVISGYKDDPEFHYVQRISIPDTNAVRRSITNIHNFNITVNRSKRTSKMGSSLHMNVGLNTMVGADKGYDFSLWPSFEYGVSITRDWRPHGPKNEFSFGLGVDWRYYRVSDKSLHWTKDANNFMTLAPYAAGQTDTRSSLFVFSVQVPLLYTHYFDKKRDWALTVGAVVNWNAMGEALYSYEEDGEEHDVTISKSGMKPFTVDGVVMVDTPWLPMLYCKYSPMTLFKNDRGPKMHQLSFGICF